VVIYLLRRNSAPQIPVVPPLAGWPVGAGALAGFFHDEVRRAEEDATHANDYLRELGWR